MKNFNVNDVNGTLSKIIRSTINANLNRYNEARDKTTTSYISGEALKFLKFASDVEKNARDFNLQLSYEFSSTDNLLLRAVFNIRTISNYGKNDSYGVYNYYQSEKNKIVVDRKDLEAPIKLTTNDFISEQVKEDMLYSTKYNNHIRNMVCFDLKTRKFGIIRKIDYNHERSMNMAQVMYNSVKKENLPYHSLRDIRDLLFSPNYNDVINRVKSKKEEFYPDFDKLYNEFLDIKNKDYISVMDEWVISHDKK
ncbi:hypothetical protein FPHOBKDP_00167 [Listeria phage LPJP1]|nr:hypothetical protein FPHOBKDP_00167 [Listeria phage LPJP1]